MAKVRFVVGLLAFLLVFSSLAAAYDKLVGTEAIRQMVSASPSDGGYTLIDARPEIKYVEGHLPWAINIPFQELNDRISELPADKNAMLVFYCGGLKCDLSHKSADLATGLGYQNVLVYAEGEPAFKATGEPLWVSPGYIKMVMNDPKRVALIVDARPAPKYLEGTIPGALNIPHPQFDDMAGILPADREMELIYFCGGYQCDLSHKSAAKARQAGYTRVKVFAGGWPEWQRHSTRAFAMVNPKDPASKPVKPAEEESFPGAMSAAQFAEKMKTPKGLLLVDVRSAADFAKGHIPGAINIPDEEIEQQADQLKGYETVVFYCATGSRAAVAYYAAESKGVQNISFLNATVDCMADGTYAVR